MESVSQHPDDQAVDRFASAMKAKLATARAKGRGGWDNPEQCSVEFLAQLLVGHLAKGNAGNFEDIGNFCMMLHQRGAEPRVLADAFAKHGQPFEVEFLSSERHQMVVIEGHVDLAEAAKIVDEEGGSRFPFPHHTWMRHTDVPEGEDASNWREVCKPNEAGAKPVTLSVIDW